MSKSSSQSRVIVITGASAGVGRAAAIAFAKQGDKLGLIARGKEKLESTLKEVRELGAEAIAISADVANHSELSEAAREVEQALGEIDIWINNAMTSVFAPIKDTNPDEFRRVTDVVYHGAVHGAMIALELMIPRNRGHIIQVGSALAHRSIPLQAAYCGAKHAIHGFLESLRSELIHDKLNIEVSEVQLPAINTPQFEWVRNKLGKHTQPVPPIFQPEVAAEAITYIADHPRREIWVGFSSVKTILGNRVAPWFIDRLLARQGYSGQTADRKPTGHDNVDSPVAKDFGARGSFDEMSKSFSFQLWLNTKARRPLAIGGTLAALGGGWLMTRREK